MNKIKNFRNISNFFFINTFFIVFTSVLIVTVLWTNDKIKYFNDIKKEMKTSYINEKRHYIKNKVDSLHDNIIYQRLVQTEFSKNFIREKTLNAYNIAFILYQRNKDRMNRNELTSLIVETIRPLSFDNKKGYYFITRMDGMELLYTAKPEMENSNLLNTKDGDGKFIIKDMIDICRNKGEGFYDYKWYKPGADGMNHQKISYIKYMSELNFFLGTGEYIEDLENNMKNQIIETVQKIKFGDGGYFFISQYDGISLTDPGKGKNNYNIQDKNGVKIVQEMINAAKKGGGYVEYIMPPFPDKKPLPKISYAKGIDDWQWYLGTGIYIYEIDDMIAAKKKELDRSVFFEILFRTLAFIFIIAVIAAIANILRISLNKQIGIFLDFIEKGDDENSKIDMKRIHYSEFKIIAQSLNSLVEKKLLFENDLKKTIKEKDMLFKELHHRVKNNLQSIAALIGLQTNYLSDPETISSLMDTGSRIQSMGLIHNKLYRSADFEKIDMNEYTKTLAEELFKTYKTNDQKINFAINDRIVMLTIDTAIPCGLILTEIITNSLKYAFTDKSCGEIRVNIDEKENKTCIFEISDNGKGLPEHTDFDKNHKLGLELIKGLTEQIKGSVILDKSSGTKYTLTFKIK